MKTQQMKTQSTPGKRLTLLALLAITLCAATPAWALLPAVHTGMFGVASGQVARVNVANIGDSGGGSIHH